MPPQDANPTPSFGGFGVTQPLPGARVRRKVHALFKILGILWLVGGGAASVGLLAQLWVIWRDPALPIGVPSFAPLIGTLPFLAFTGAAVGNGLGLVTRKRWSRILTITLSPILLLFSFASVALIGAATGIMPLILTVVLFVLGLSGLLVMLSSRGKRAFEVYVS